VVRTGSPPKAPYRLIQGSRPITERIDIPFLIFTKEDMFLIQGISETSINQSLSPIVAMRRPLHPNRWIESLMSCDRHCFFSQIPELGVFIVGSPVGRAGICSLYYTKDEDTGQPRYGFKLEYILPFRSDNDKRIAGAPYTKLLGVAVAPVQGKIMLITFSAAYIARLTSTQACLTPQKIRRDRIKRCFHTLVDGAC
jgi:hypothetical protein